MTSGWAGRRSSRQTSNERHVPENGRLVGQESSFEYTPDLTRRRRDARGLGLRAASGGRGQRGSPTATGSQLSSPIDLIDAKDHVDRTPVRTHHAEQPDDELPGRPVPQSRRTGAIDHRIDLAPRGSGCPYPETRPTSSQGQPVRSRRVPCEWRHWQHRRPPAPTCPVDPRSRGSTHPRAARSLPRRSPEA